MELIRRAFEAANRGDFASIDSYVHPEIEFHTFAQSPEAGVYRGKEAVRKYNEDLFEQFESIRFEVEELVDAGDRVVVLSTQRAVPKGGQQEMRVHVAEVWAIRDGLLAERRSYSSRGPRSRRPVRRMKVKSFKTISLPSAKSHLVQVTASKQILGLRPAALLTLSQNKPAAEGSAGVRCRLTVKVPSTRTGVTTRGTE